MADKLSAHRTPRGDSSSESSGLTKAPVGVLDAHRCVDAPTTQDVGRKRAQQLTAIGTRRRLAGGCFRSMVSVCVAAMVLGTVAALLAAAPAQAQTRTLSIERGPFPASISTADGGVYLRYRISSDVHSWWDNCNRTTGHCSIAGVRGNNGHAVGVNIEWERPWPGKALTGHGGADPDDPRYHEPGYGYDVTNLVAKTADGRWYWEQPGGSGLSPTRPGRCSPR